MSKHQQSLSLFPLPKMANDFFRFKQFLVRQSACAMKVGTDGTLLGAWAHGGKQILDIGTGTGLIALMMAQRFAGSHVTAIDIDEAAYVQAAQNVKESPFSCRIQVVKGNICEYKPSLSFDAVVSNPPFFRHSLECPSQQRTLARHASSLSYHDLMACVWRLLDEQGEFSVVIPSECKAALENEALLRGFFKSRECAVRTTPRKAPRRFLLAFTKHPVGFELTEGIIESSLNMRSPWYQQLTNDFYL